jgi:hypothetical protein
MSGKVIAGILTLFVIVLYAGSVYWSQEPDGFSVMDAGAVEAENIGKTAVIGVVTTAALVKEIETLLHKPGGYVSNDKMVPFIIMDNMPSWEFGVLVQTRDMARAMRDSMSRSQSQSKEDPDLARAESRLNISNTAWAFPEAESEYEETVKYLRRYIARLSDGDNQAQFYARSDNLSHWLRIVEVRLGSLSQRLSASVGQRRLNTDLAGDIAAQQSTHGEVEVLTKTPWLEIDDVFYESRGTAWALIHLLQAIEVDFAEVLKKKNATVSLAQIIRELEATQATLYSPMILNGSGFGLWANHSLVMASYISRANAATIDLRMLLEKG